MKIALKDIYFEFFKLGLQLLGGGYVIVPLMKNSIVEKRKWISEEELINFYALSQSIPGVIAANISTFTGYKLRKKTGALIALLGILTSPVISIIIIASIIDKFMNLFFIQNIFTYITTAVIILIYLTIKEMWTYSIKDYHSWIIFSVSLILSYFLKISPVYIIIFAILYGIIIRNPKGEL